MRSLSRSLQFLALAALLPLSASAESFNFSNLSGADVDNVSKELAANFAYSSLAPASSLGGFGGFEFGLTAGITKIPETLKIVQRSNASTTLKDKFPHGNILL